MKKSYILSAIFAASFSISAPAQTYFQKVFSSVPYDDEAQDVLPTSDGGFLFAGYTNTSLPDDCDVLVFKADAAGNEQWRTTFGGAKPDFPYHMLEAADGNYFLAGYSQSYGPGDYDILLLKIEPDGDLIWSKTYGSNGNELSRDIIATHDGNYIIVGWSKAAGQPDYNAHLVKIDINGNEIWTKTFGTVSDDFGNSIAKTSDGGYVMVGQTFGFGTSGGDAWLVKLNSSCDTTWTKTFGGAHNDEGYHMTVAPDGGFVFLVRDSSTAGQDIDTRIIKTDASGNVVWNKVYGGDKKDTPKYIQNSSDGGFIACGNSRSFGWINPEMWILKLTPAGDTTWTRRYGGEQNEHCYVIRELSSGGYIGTGKTASYGPTFDPIFIKINSEGTMEEDGVGITGRTYAGNTILLYPNPANGKVFLDATGFDVRRVRICNALGSELMEQTVVSDQKFEVDLTGQPRGLYYIHCETSGGSFTRKLVLN